MKDIDKMLVSYIRKEIQDVENYLQFLNAAIQDEDEYLARKIQKIIRDECSHVTFWYNYLHKINVEMAEEEKQNYDNLIKEIHNLPKL